MAVLTEIVKTVLVIIILASFLELLLPEGKVKPFVRFAIGLFILIAVLNPGLSLLFGDHNFDVDSWDYTGSIGDAEEIIKKGTEIRERVVQENTELVKEKVQGQINSVVTLVPGVHSADTLIEMTEEGVLEKIYITIIPEEGDKGEEENDGHIFSQEELAVSEEEKGEIQDKVISVIRNLYGLKNTDIEIRFERG